MAKKKQKDEIVNKIDNQIEETKEMFESEETETIQESSFKPVKIVIKKGTRESVRYVSKSLAERLIKANKATIKE